MFRFLLQQRANVLLKNLSELASSTGVDILQPEETEMMCWLYDSRQPSEEFCEKAEIFYGHMKARYGWGKNREESNVQTLHERGQPTRTSSIVKPTQSMKTTSETVHFAKIDYYSAFPAKYSKVPWLLNCRPKSSAKPLPPSKMTRTLCLNGSVKMLHKSRPLSHMNLFLAEEVSSSSHTIPCRTTKELCENNKSKKNRKNRKFPSEQPPDGIVENQDRSSSKQAIPPLKKIQNKQNIPEKTAKSKSKKKLTEQTNRVDHVQFRPPVLSNNPLDLTRRPMKSQASKSKIASATSIHNNITLRLKEVVQSLASQNKTQRKKILDIGFWMKPFVNKFDNESKVRREEAVSVQALETEKGIPTDSKIGTKVRFNLEVLEIDEIQEPVEYEAPRPQSSKSLIQFAI